MKRVPLGNSGVEASVFCLGAMYFGTRTDQEMSYRLLAYSPLSNGAYTRSDRSFSKQYLGPDSKARLVTLRSVASEVGATLNQVILAWMVQSDPMVIPLVATSTLE